MILVDSSVWIDYFNGARTPRTDKLDTLLGLESLVIGDLILAEVLQGFASESDFAHAKSLLTSLIVVELGGTKIAVQAANNFRLLRKCGITVRKTIDMIIATYCIETGLQLLHGDRDFDGCARYLGLQTVACD